jgi:hypothetical protein
MPRCCCTAKAGQPLIDDLGRAARSDRSADGLHGVPARVLPVALWHTASVGLDLWLLAWRQGASQVWVLLTDEEAPEYRRRWPSRWRSARRC